MILVIDNYDSFTWNLVQYIAEIDDDVRVVRNDQFDVGEELARGPRRIVVSPGPGIPSRAGRSLEVIAEAGDVPLLGVCLGHQSIGEAFGGKIVRAATLMHGKTSEIHHDGRGVFRDLPSPFVATRYHSLVIDPASVPEELEVTARTADEVIMAVRHRSRPLEGVQFHPESILTEHGRTMIRNFLEDRND